MHFTLELADFTVSYASLRTQNYSLLVGKNSQASAEDREQQNTQMKGIFHILLKYGYFTRLMQKSLMTMADL